MGCIYYIIMMIEYILIIIYCIKLNGMGYIYYIIMMMEYILIFIGFIGYDDDGKYPLPDGLFKKIRYVIYYVYLFFYV